MLQIFEDRKEAGKMLILRLQSILKAEQDVVLLALARGGVPVGFEIAKALNMPLEVLIVRKIGHPLQPEYGIGAITEDGSYWVNKMASGIAQVTDLQLQSIVETEKKEIQRRKSYYRHGRELISLTNKCVVLIDDGLATGATAQVAARFVRGKGASKIIFATPVAALDTAKNLQPFVDRMVVLHKTETFMSVSNFYQKFDQVSDSEVLALLDAEHGPVQDGIENVIVKNAEPLNEKSDLGPLIKKISKSKVVLLGESSHGTQEFYEWRRLISQELITYHGFSFIAVEGDWPPCGQVNRYVQGKSTETPVEVLKHFKRWPTWMWANTETQKLMQWMRGYNSSTPLQKKVGFYGLDVYSLFESIDEVHRQLVKISPALANRILVRYHCFKRFMSETAYAKSLIKFPEGCEGQVLKALQELLNLRLSTIEQEQLFDARQNAHIVKGAENYYRSMVFGDDNSWNIRDQHMTDTLDRLLNFYGTAAKGIVWAHNTHIGDYRATDMLQAGQINIGGLARKKWGPGNVSLIGFGTNSGQVLASHAWDGPIEVMDVPPGKTKSYEAVFHAVSQRIQENSFFIWLQDRPELKKVLGHRAIGVVYSPVYESRGNYVPTSLAQRYDGFVFVDHSTALHPLIQKFTHSEIPETWPEGV